MPKYPEKRDDDTKYTRGMARGLRRSLWAIMNNCSPFSLKYPGYPDEESDGDSEKGERDEAKDRPLD